MTRYKYLRRVSCVSGKECDGTLREVDSAYAESNKVVPQAYNLSLMRGQVFFWKPYRPISRDTSIKTLIEKEKDNDKSNGNLIGTGNGYDDALGMREQERRKRGRDV